MSLFAGALLVSLGIAVCCLLPWVFPAVRANSKKLMVLGTLILLGFVIFDLIPETVEIAGPSMYVAMALSAIFFSGLHLVTSRKHEHHEGGSHHHGLTSLLSAMAIHCIAGGVMLVASFEISEALASSVLWSLIAHKGFEAVSVSSLLYARARSHRQLFTCVTLYALSFPFGVGLAIGLELGLADVVEIETIELAAMYVTSLAIGSLFACLLQDFLLPSLKELRVARQSVRRRQSA